MVGEFWFVYKQNKKQTFIYIYIRINNIMKNEIGAKAWKQGSSLVITVPSWLVEAYSIKEGSVLIFELKEVKENAEEV